MRNNIKHALAVLAAAAILLAFAGCADSFFGDDEQTTITITGLDALVGKYASGGLANPDPAQSKKKDRDLAIAWPTSIKADGTVTLEMIKPDSKPASVNNLPAIVILFINSNSSTTNQTNEIEKFSQKTLKPGSNTIAYSDFLELN